MRNMRVAGPLPGRVLAILFAASVSGPGFAQDPMLVLTTVKGPAVYHLGERIEVGLTFSADGNDFGFTSSGTERTSLGTLEEFRAVSLDNGAARGHAPYDPHFDGVEFGWVLGGSRLSSMLRLSKTPRKLNFDLNAWMRITAPGKYGVTVESRRISRFSDAKLQLPPEPVPIESNQVEITILPADPEWVSGELRNIRETLDSSNGERDRIFAARRLSYLDALDSTAEMAARFVASEAGTYRNVLFQALLEASARDVAIAALETSFLDNHKQVPPEIYDVLATLYSVREFQGRPLPSQSQARIEALQERQERYRFLIEGLRRLRPDAH